VLALDLAELWAYRELLYFFVWRDIEMRYKQTIICAAWAILQPLMTMLVFILFFGRLTKIPSEGLAEVKGGSQWALTGHGQPPRVLMVASSTAAVGLLFLVGLIYFHAVEGKIADVV
jgi:hypothetical protein